MCLTKKEMNQNYFSKVTESCVNVKTEFRKIIEPFLTNNGFLSGTEITLKEYDEVVTKEKILAEKLKITTEILLNNLVSQTYKFKSSK